MLIKKYQPGIRGLVTKTVLNTKIGEVENKIPGMNGLVTNSVFITKTGEVMNEILNVIYFVQKSDYDAKTTDVEGKYFTTADYNKFTSDILDTQIKQKNWSTNLIFLIP